MNIPLAQEKKSGRNYQAEGFKICYRYKNTVAGDNDVNVAERIYLISGQAKMFLKNESWKIDAPSKVVIPENTYHKIEAITDIAFILFED